MSDESILELISRVDEFLGMHDLFKDDDLDFALSRIVKIITKPDIPPQTAVNTIVQLEAIAAKLHLQACWYKNVDKPKVGTIEYQKKTMYFSFAESIRQLCAALKYVVKL